MKNFQTIIQVNELAVFQSHGNVVILDCRHDLADPNLGCAAYLTGHIPGAQFAALDSQLSGAKTGQNGRHPLPDRQAFAQILSAWGIANDTQVVAYDAHGGMFAARLWWMLRWCGHAAVAVLDGGLAAWQAAGHELTTDLPVIQPTTFELRPSLVELVVVEQVEANLTAVQPRLIVDARSPDRFRGENETLDPIGGRIPGAVNRFFKDNLQADATFKSPEILRAEWQTVLQGYSPAHSIMQCGSGVTACHNLLALEFAGLPGAALYAGSWSEWCSLITRPVIVG